MMLKSGLSIIPFLLLITLLPLEARSEEKPAAETSSAAAPAEKATEDDKPAPHSNIMPVKIKPVQEGADGVSKAAPNIEQAPEIDLDALALYTTQGDGSLGPDAWNGLSRSEIVKSFNNLPVPRFSPIQRELALRALLTKATIPAQSDDQDASDIFTARLTKLIELGALKEAMALIEKLDSPASNEEAARAGMKAFIGNGQIAIACLEQKALGSGIKKEDPFWTHLDKFCKTYIKAEGDDGDVAQNLMHAALAYSQSEKVLAPARFEDLNTATVIELLVLAKSGALDRGKWNVATASSINPSVVAFLLAMEPSQTAEKLSLMTVAVGHGLRSPADLEATYKEKASAPGEWTAIVAGAIRLANTPTTDKATTLKAMLASAEATSPAAYTPFAQTLADTPPAAPFTPADARFVLRVFLAAQIDIPLAWVNFAYGAKFDGESGESALLKIWNGELPDTKKDGDKALTAKPVKKGKMDPDLAYSRVLQDFLSDTPNMPSGQNYTYDNFLILTGSTNYVMPSDELTESLKRAAASKHLGKIIMYGLQALNGQKADQIHPAVLFQVLKAYKTAGLSEETASLAHEALSGLTKEKKEN